MNKMHAVGSLYKEPTLTELSSGRQAMNLVLSVEKNANAVTPNPIYINVVSYGVKGFADEIIKGLKKGSMYSVYGKLNKKRSENDKHVYDNETVEVSLSEIRRAGDGAEEITRLILTGNITDDARLNSVSDERDAVNFTVATNDGYRNEAGDWIDNDPVYHDCSRYVKKGSGAKLQAALMKGREVEVEGYITRVKPSASSNGKTYHTHSVVCTEVIPRRKPQGKAEDQAHEMPADQQLPQDVIDHQDDEIKF